MKRHGDKKIAAQELKKRWVSYCNEQQHNGKHSQVPHDCPRRLYNKKGFFARAIICICMGVEEKNDTLFGKKNYIRKTSRQQLN